jgi:hypothetical protein
VFVLFFISFVYLFIFFCFIRFICFIVFMFHSFFLCLPSFFWLTVYNRIYFWFPLPRIKTNNPNFETVENFLDDCKKLHFTISLNIIEVCLFLVYVYIFIFHVCLFVVVCCCGFVFCYFLFLRLFYSFIFFVISFIRTLGIIFLNIPISLRSNFRNLCFQTRRLIIFTFV